MGSVTWQYLGYTTSRLRVLAPGLGHFTRGHHLVALPTCPTYAQVTGKLGARGLGGRGKATLSRL